MGSSQVIVRERHGKHLRLVCYALGGAHTWDAEWQPYSPESVRFIMEYYRRFSSVYRTLVRVLPRDGQLLEAGSGLGHWVALLSEAGYDVRGMDCSEEALEQSRRTFPGLRFDQGDVRELPYPDRSLSGYISFGVAEHFRGGPEPVLREAARVLRPGGVMIFAVPWISPLRRLQPDGGDRPPEDGHFYQYFFESGEVEELVAASGFRPVTRTSYGAMKTVRDFSRSFRSRKPDPEIEPARRSSRVASTPPAVSALRKAFWSCQNLAFENPLARRFAGHMLLLVAERT